MVSSAHEPQNCWVGWPEKRPSPVQHDRGKAGDGGLWEEAFTLPAMMLASSPDGVHDVVVVDGREVEFEHQRRDQRGGPGGGGEGQVAGEGAVHGDGGGDRDAGGRCQEGL